VEKAIFHITLYNSLEAGMFMKTMKINEWTPPLQQKENAIKHIKHAN